MEGEPDKRRRWIRHLPAVVAIALALGAGALLLDPRTSSPGAAAEGSSGSVRLDGAADRRARGPAHDSRAARGGPRKLPATPDSLDGNGELGLVGGRSSSGAGSGPTLRLAVEVERGLEVNGRAFARQVERTLYDDRSWAARRGMRLARVAELGSHDVLITLASPATTDRLCAPVETNGRYSCENGGRVVINAMRWRDGAEPFDAGLVSYRRYLLNHEFGHALGQGHRECPAAGGPAPVMLQQSKGTGACDPHSWPLDEEL